MSQSRIAVLLTCHNRVDRTLTCLTTLAAQTETAVELDVVLVDAGSSDGTAAAVRQRFPDVTVLERGPELFWNGGMRVALASAYEREPNIYLWLNDDVALDPDALQSLLRCHDELSQTRQSPAIVAGSTRDPVTGRATYGGVVRPDRLRQMRYQLVTPADHAQQVETMNGNCVLVPREVVERIGNLAEVFTHGMGDYDYGHRATRAGCEVWIAPGTIGTCARNPSVARASSFSEQRQRLTSPTGGLPPHEWLVFARRWAGPVWPLYVLSPYVRRYGRWALGR